MRDVRNKREYEDRDRELSRETDEQLDDEKEEARQLEDIKRAFDDLNDTALTETKDHLNKIVDATKTKGMERIETAQEKVEDGVETERKEISDPAEENSSIAKFDAGGLEVASRSIERYEGELLDAMREKDEESEFFTELAEQSKDHQETDRREGQETAAEARNALNALRSF